MTKILLCALFASRLVLLLYGQAPLAKPVVGGFPVHCQDPTGAIVYMIYGPIQTGDIAQSGIAAAGMRFIQFNPPKMSALPGLFQLFTYAHECGHHLSGDIIAGVFFHHDNPAREMNADRIGIRLLRDQLNISQSQAKEIASVFQNQPAMPPYYLPGPERAKWIVDCYKSHDDSCGNSTADYSRTGADSAQENGAGKDDKTERKAACRSTYDECIAKVMPASQCVANNVRNCSRGCNPDMPCNCGPERFEDTCSDNEKDSQKRCARQRDQCIRDVEDEKEE